MGIVVGVFLRDMRARVGGEGVREHEACICGRVTVAVSTLSFVNLAVHVFEYIDSRAWSSACNGVKSAAHHNGHNIMIFGHQY